jgi:hypothetical protein
MPPDPQGRAVAEAGLAPAISRLWAWRDATSPLRINATITSMARSRRLPNRGTKRWSIRYHGTKRKLRRAVGLLWDYNYDGVYWHERIPAGERRRWRKWLDRKTLEQDLLDYQEEAEML